MLAFILHSETTWNQVKYVCYYKISFLHSIVCFLLLQFTSWQRELVWGWQLPGPGTRGFTTRYCARHSWRYSPRGEMHVKCFTQLSYNTTEAQSLIKSAIWLSPLGLSYDYLCLAVFLTMLIIPTGIWDSQQQTKLFHSMRKERNVSNWSRAKKKNDSDFRQEARGIRLSVWRQSTDAELWPPWEKLLCQCAEDCYPKKPEALPFHMIYMGVWIF